MKIRMQMKDDAMERLEDILERYYRGETTVAEERELKRARQQGKLPDDPMLAYTGRPGECPGELLGKIQADIRRLQRRRFRWIGWTMAGSVAVGLILIFSFEDLFTSPFPSGIQLSDNTKKERFEHALRVIGNVLEERTPPVQKVLYEDNKLIITVE